MKPGHSKQRMNQKRAAETKNVQQKQKRPAKLKLRRPQQNMIAYKLTNRAITPH